MPDFRLQIFHAVATHLSFTKAAVLLEITQPAVSKNIGELEHSFQVKLFERKGNKIKLTDAGYILLDYTKKLMILYDNMFFDVAFAPKDIEGQLRINAVSSIGQYVLPDMVARFIKIFPKVRLSIQHIPEDWQALQKNHVDFYLTQEPTVPSNFASLTVLDDPLVLFAYTGESASMNVATTSNPFQAMPLVTLTSMKPLLSSIISTSNRQIQYFEQAETIKQLMRHVPWVGLLPKHCLTAYELQEDFEVLKTFEDWGKRYCRLVYNPESLGEIGQVFLTYIQNNRK